MFKIITHTINFGLLHLLIQRLTHILEIFLFLIFRYQHHCVVLIILWILSLHHRDSDADWKFMKNVNYFASPKKLLTNVTSCFSTFQLVFLVPLWSRTFRIMMHSNFSADGNNMWLFVDIQLQLALSQFL